MSEMMRKELALYMSFMDSKVLKVAICSAWKTVEDGGNEKKGKV